MCMRTCPRSVICRSHTPGTRIWVLKLLASGSLVNRWQLQWECMAPKGLWDILLWSKQSPAAISHGTTASSHRPLLSVRGLEGLWHFVSVFFPQVCTSKCAQVSRGVRVSCPAAMRDLTWSFSQHKNLTNTGKVGVPPGAPGGMKKPESIQ